MKEFIKVLEVPFYLLVIALYAFNNGDNNAAIFLIIVSIFRLIVNNMENEFIKWKLKRKK
tara:strand:+ start:564 stop:743 length:180 start_codon:yes stop_codon:yes gene_type:complete